MYKIMFYYGNVNKYHDCKSLLYAQNKTNSSFFNYSFNILLHSIVYFLSVWSTWTNGFENQFPNIFHMIWSFSYRLRGLL